MDKNMAMGIIEALGREICRLKNDMESVIEYCKVNDERCEKLIKRVHELEGFDSEKARAECEEIANGEPERNAE